ncbi:C40 family peptidase, partial [Mycobacteroides chelonae]|uniref:C40 family peptidase n=1 Tax=Mycobacteroides chelonae TaxID=1774 RepID=UPI0009BD32E7
APRLTASDLAKASPYQSGMPTSQTAAPSMPQLPMSAMSAPMQAAQGLGAPIQSMLGSPGAISPILDQMLSKVAGGGGMDGGPTSLPMGASQPGDAGKVQDITRRWLGTPYAWGGGAMDGPSKGISDGGGPADRAGDYNKIGFDCSGWSRYLTHEAFGLNIPRTSEQQFAAGIPVSGANVRPGDLFFPSDSGRPPGHVAVVLDSQTMAEAPSSGQSLKISPLRAGEFRTFRSG